MLNNAPVPDAQPCTPLGPDAHLLARPAGLVQEGKAEQAAAAIQGMLSSKATVIRGGERKMVDAKNVVPGDVCFIQSGDRCPADLRMIEVSTSTPQRAGVGVLAFCISGLGVACFMRTIVDFSPTEQGAIHAGDNQSSRLEQFAESWFCANIGGC